MSARAAFLFIDREGLGAVNNTRRLKQVIKWTIAAIIWAIPLLSFRTAPVGPATWASAYVTLTLLAVMFFYKGEDDGMTRRERQALAGMVVILVALLFVAIYGLGSFLHYGINSDFGYLAFHSDN